MTLDAAHGVLVVACTDRLVSFSLSPGPERRGSVETGLGVDNIDFAAKTGAVYAAAGKAERLTRAQLQPDGVLHATGEAHTAPGVRVVVVTPAGKAFAADSAGGQLWVTGP